MFNLELEQQKKKFFFLKVQLQNKRTIMSHSGGQAGQTTSIVNVGRLASRGVNLLNELQAGNGFPKNVLLILWSMPP